MTTQYPNQSVQYSDLSGNTATLTPNIGLVLSNGVTNLTMNQTGFTNGVQTLLFQDIYATVGKTESVKYLTSTATSLNVQDTILVDDAAGINSTIITPTTLTMTSGVNTNTLTANDWTGSIKTVSTAANATHYLNFSDAFATGQGNPQKTLGVTVNPSTKTITATAFVGALIGAASTVVTLTDNSSTTCYLPFIKTIAGSSTPLFVDDTLGPLSYVPSTSTLTATNFSGTASTSTAITLTTDNTATTCYLAFSKTTAGTSKLLYVDDTTGPLTYVPSTSTLTATNFSGNLIAPVTQNTATFAGTTLSVSGASTGQNVTLRNSSIVITGALNTISSLTPTNMVINGTYNVGILNSGSGNLTINTGLGANIKTVYSGAFNVPTGRHALMTINVISINAVTTYIVNAVQLID